MLDYFEFSFSTPVLFGSFPYSASGNSTLLIIQVKILESSMIPFFFSHTAYQISKQILLVLLS